MKTVALLLVTAAFAAICAAQPMSPPPYVVSSGPAGYPTMPGATTVSLGDDDLSNTIQPSGFSFNFYGTSHNCFRIGSNGYVLMGSIGTSTSPTPAHATDGPAISPFWADLAPDLGGTVSWLLVSTVLFVEWRNVPVRVGGDTTTYGVTVAIEINCSNMSINCYYATPTAGGFTALPTSSANSVAISRAPGAGSYQTINGFDGGFIASNGAVTTYPTGRAVTFWKNPPPINPLEITTNNTLPVGYDGQPYTAGLNASGGVMPYTAWVAGGLPQGFTLNMVGSANQAQLAAANGADVHGGVYQVWIEVFCPTNGHDLESFRLPINPPRGVAGQPYACQMNASGGFTPHVWSGVSLPSWLTLTQSGQLLASTLPGPGTYAFDVSVQDSGPNPWIYQGQLELIVDPAALAIMTTSPLPSGTEYTAYSHTMQAGGGVAPYLWSATGLPAGWQMSAAGAVSAPAASVQAGTYTFDVSVTDSDPAGASTVTQPSAVTVGALPPLVIQTTLLPDAEVGYAYSASITASGGSSSGYAWTIVAGTLPPGLNLAGSGTPTALLDGTPTTAGPFTFEVQVTDDVGYTTTATLSIVAQAPGLGSNSSSSGGDSGGCASQVSGTGWWWLVWLAALGGLAGVRMRRLSR